MAKDADSPALTALYIGHVILAATALLGGGLMLADPSGENLGMPLEMLAETGFSDYLLPGVILFVVLGLGTTLALILGNIQPDWDWLQELQPKRNLHWSWWALFAPGPALLVWIGVQIMLIGYQSLLQPVYGVLGLVLTVLALTPGVKQHFKLSEGPE